MDRHIGCRGQKAADANYNETMLVDSTTQLYKRPVSKCRGTFV